MYQNEKTQVENTMYNLKIKTVYVLHAESSSWDVAVLVARVKLTKVVYLGREQLNLPNEVVNGGLCGSSSHRYGSTSLWGSSGLQQLWRVRFPVTTCGARQGGFKSLGQIDRSACPNEKRQLVWEARDETVHDVSVSNLQSCSQIDHCGIEVLNALVWLQS